MRHRGNASFRHDHPLGLRASLRSIGRHREEDPLADATASDLIADLVDDADALHAWDVRGPRPPTARRRACLPSRSPRSTGFTAAAMTRKRSCPRPGCGSGNSTTSSTSGPPKRCKPTARTTPTPLAPVAGPAGRVPCPMLDNHIGLCAGRCSREPPPGVSGPMPRFVLAMCAPWAYSRQQYRFWCGPCGVRPDRGTDLCA
jgi:hypothetical protein